MRAEGENNRWVERWTKDGKIFYLTKLGSVSNVIKSSCSVETHVTCLVVMI